MRRVYFLNQVDAAAYLADITAAADALQRLCEAHAQQQLQASQLAQAAAVERAQAEQVRQAAAKAAAAAQAQQTALQRKQAEMEARIAKRNAAQRAAAPSLRKPKLSPRLALGSLVVVEPPSGVPAPVEVKPHKPVPTEVVIPANVRRSYAPAPPGRYAVTQPVAGGFASMRPGQYLPETGFSAYLETAT